MSYSKSKTSKMDYVTRQTTILGIPTTVISPVVKQYSSSNANNGTFNPYKVYSDEERRVHRKQKEDFIKMKLQMEQTKILFKQLKHSYDS